jgi:hypothetical protein
MQAPKPIKYDDDKKNYLNETDKKVIRIAAYSLGTALAGTALFFLGRHIYRNTVSNKEQNQSLTDNTDSNFAKRLKMAFDNDGWWGTDVEAVRKVFVEIQSKDVFVETVKSYKKLYSRNLVEDLTDELTTSEYYEVQNILAAKPQKVGQQQVFDLETAKRFAKRFKAAFDYTVMGMSATDKGALIQVFADIKTKQVFELIKLAYKSLYGTSLETDLDDELDMFDFSWRDLIKQKPLK